MGGGAVLYPGGLRHPGGEIGVVLLIAGPSHTGKTALSQRLLERYGYPYLSIDHLKMGLIRSRRTTLTPESADQELTEFLWPVVREMVKTAIENKQNLIVEGCYIPFDWKKSFEAAYLAEIRYVCLVMSPDYIANRFGDIRKFANIVEDRLDDGGLSIESGTTGRPWRCVGGTAAPIF